MIETRHLSHRVITPEGPLDILCDINLRIECGESIAVVGASGSGKSTLLSMLAGLDIPSDGEILLHGKTLPKFDEEARALVRSQLVAFVFQNFQLLPALTALENIALPLEIHNRPKPQILAQDYLHRVGLQDRGHHFPSQLSGGEQQRVALARAFACRAPIIFADEPTGNLDSVTGEKITHLLFELNREKHTTLVLVTHSTALANRCDRIFEIKGGKLFPHDTTQPIDQSDTTNTISSPPANGA